MSDIEDDWEEELVVVELSGIINSDFLTKCQGGTCKILDIDSERPIMQVGPYVFAGEYEDFLGTCVLFQEENITRQDTDAGPQLKYKCHTGKKLMMQRIFLSEKKEGETSSEKLDEPLPCDVKNAETPSHSAKGAEQTGNVEETGQQTTEEGEMHQDLGS
ncbi:general transcription factor 3C polypeptide 6 isoform X2 [Hypomesus transpacificus]|uniref:general transcription factor 3C polypeptide 6 isoform X2 n=1 Tax=Hypomesus transpacificus TaxID=137520 RepID=UPI001F07E494|nr:general transcription factor 3C polypeptide 6 isoform X2 [Hypomesus transpacificus]